MRVVRLIGVGACLAALFGASGQAAAQTATVRTLARGGASVVVAPGEAIAISVVLTHNQFCFAGLEGGTIVTGDAGAGSGFASILPLFAGLSLGEFRGGSRVSAVFAYPGGGGHITQPPVWWANPLTIWEYDLRIDEPGTYEIAWVAPATAPNARVYASIASFSFLEAQTTYVGATITVVPGASTAGVVGAFGLLAATRNRETRP